MRNPPSGESLRERWARRAIVYPAYLGALVILAAALPLLLILTVSIDLPARRNFVFTRTLLFLFVYLLCEGVGLFVGLALWLARLVPGFGSEEFLRASFRAQQYWARALFGAGRFLFRLRLEVEGDAAVAEAARAGAILVFLRHASTADTVLPVVLVSSPHNVLLRYVMKRELLWDPCLDLYGQRLPNAFVRRGSRDPLTQVALVERLSRDLGSGDGILLYPEGTRFSQRARERLLARLEIDGDFDKLEHARSFRSVLPPKIGGAMACIEQNPDATIIFCAHTGFDEIRTFREFASGNLLGTNVRVRFWSVPVSSIPTDPDERIAWLSHEWHLVDEFCAAAGPGETVV